jgi:uncharacterized surface protein with fasciclin (FAS1) repeats
MIDARAKEAVAPKNHFLESDLAIGAKDPVMPVEASPQSEKQETMKKTIATLLIGAMTLAGQAGECQNGANKNIVETAVAAGSFKTLAAALGAADLAGALQGKGPFTVFAPTDAAFAKLPKGTVASLLKTENKGKLQDILKYHVVSGAVDLSGALKAGTAPTLQGDTVKIGFGDGRVRINGSNLVTADIKTSNGIIHVIDSVLLPPEPKNDIASVAKKAGSFKTLLAAVDAAGLTGVLTGKDKVTVLAPTDAAFKALPKGTVESLLKPANRKKLTEILTLHVIKGSVPAGAALSAGNARSVSNGALKFGINNGKFQVNGVTIVKTDIKCDNGIIHVIDAVLLPPAKTAAKQSPGQMIELAISKGAPAFNNGHPDQCAGIYMSCVESLAQNHGLNASTRKMLAAVAMKAKSTHCPTTRSWILRDGLDRAYAASTAGH